MSSDEVNKDGPNTSTQTIAIIGCGLIGQAWAVVFLKAGFRAVLYDLDQAATSQARDAIVGRLIDLASYQLLEPGEVERLESNIVIAPELKVAVQDAIYVQESGAENVDVKATLTAEIDQFAQKDVPIGSSTSGIPASDYAVDVQGRHRCLVAHPINPPHLVPAVELVPSPWTSQATINTVSELMHSVGQSPVLLQKEVDGFVVNRLQGALLTEAFSLLEQGVASAEDIDKAIADGLGLRWSIMGPFETIHLNAPGGIAQYVERYGPLYRKMIEQNTSAEDWRIILNKGLEQALCDKHAIADLASSQAERDRALMALLAHRQSANKRS